MRWLLLLLLCILQSLLCQSVLADVPPIPRPDHTEHARLARWLTHMNTWGTLSTQGSQGCADGPAAGVVSFSDGPLDSAHAGRLFFYLTPMDETGHHIQAHPDCALSVSEAQLHPGGCGSTDPMEPTCARISVLGQMLPVDAAADKAVAEKVLFDKHPAMKRWPADHGFIIYELHLREIHMLDWYGGMHIVSPDDYFAADLKPQQQQQQQEERRGEAQHVAALARRFAAKTGQAAAAA